MCLSYITAVFMYLSLIRPNPQPLPYQGRGVNQSLSEVYQRGRFVVYLPENNNCKKVLNPKLLKCEITLK